MSGTVTPEDHAWFTGVSGDANPIHADPIASRRLLGGRMLAHGAHLLLRALDDAARTGALDAVPDRVHVLFRQGVAPGDPIDIDVAGTAGDDVVVRLTGGGRELAVVTITAEDAGLAPYTPADQAAERPQGPRPLDLDGLAALVGTEQPRFRPPVDASSLADRFPAATALLGAGRVTEVAAISFVVGMLTPGRSSMSSSYDIRWREPADDPLEIAHTLDRFDARLRRAQLTVTGPSMHAAVTAFSPPPPVDQRAAIDDGDRPHADEFAGWRALVVGGSRGLGSATARLLVAGGADVRITWAACEHEARQVADELGVRALQWMAPGTPVDALTDAGWAPTHLCWFASPPSDDDPAAHAIEVDAFAQAVAVLAGSLEATLWPSTTLLEQPAATGAFVARKRAGEDLCARLGAHAGRLPTLLTDRTQSLLPREYGDTAHELLSALRAMRAR